MSSDLYVCCRYIQSTCATSGEGLYEGLDWLSNNIASKVGSQCFVGNNGKNPCFVGCNLG